MPQSLTFTTELLIEPVKLTEYVDALNDVLPHSRPHSGCIFLYVNQSSTDPNKFLLFERWRDREEFEKDYLNRDYFKRYLATTE